MKILHLVAGNMSGGAAKGAYSLHLAQRKIGVNSVILNNGKEKIIDKSVINLAATPLKNFKYSVLNRIGNLPVLLYSGRKHWIFSTGVSGGDITKHPEYSEADIIHLHWINGFIPMHMLRKIKKPIVWSLRDMWPLTGGCHVGAAIDCEKYKLGCGKCPQLGSNHSNDLSSFVVKYKKKFLPNHIHVIGISKWLSKCASESLIFEGYKITTISNSINSADFFPIDKKLARTALKLPSNKKILLLGAQNLNDYHKGFDLFLKAVKELDTAGLHLVFFGNSIDGDMLSEIDIEWTSLGYLNEIVKIRQAYNAADVFIAPSRVEAFGKTIAEAMSCGVPTVCFDSTGQRDIVQHKVSGYKATPFESEDLASGINWVLNNLENKSLNLSENARARIVEYFDSSVIALEYIKLYKNILGN